MQYHDKSGQPFEIKTGREDDSFRLLEMYTTFSPRGGYQGLPPINLQTCLSWIGHLFKSGENFLAWRGDAIIGHAALLPDLTLRDGEYLVFMHQDYRGQGIGTALTRCAIERAQELALAQLWLTVNADNYIAIRLYRKCGFQFSGRADFESERKMVLVLLKDDASPAPEPGCINKD